MYITEYLWKEHLLTLGGIGVSHCICNHTYQTLQHGNQPMGFVNLSSQTVAISTNEIRELQPTSSATFEATPFRNHVGLFVKDVVEGDISDDISNFNTIRIKRLNDRLVISKRNRGIAGDAKKITNLTNHPVSTLVIQGLLFPAFNPSEGIFPIRLFLTPKTVHVKEPYTAIGKDPEHFLLNPIEQATTTYEYQPGKIIIYENDGSFIMDLKDLNNYLERYRVQTVHLV